MAKAGIDSSDAQRVLASAAAVSGGKTFGGAAVVHKPNDIPSIEVHRPFTASAKSQFSCGGSTLPGNSPGAVPPPANKQPKLAQSAVALALLSQQQQQQQQQKQAVPSAGVHGKPPLPQHMKSTAPSFPLIPASGQPMPVQQHLFSPFCSSVFAPCCNSSMCNPFFVCVQRVNRAMTPGTKARVDAFKVPAHCVS
jgi:hypothetical protein